MKKNRKKNNNVIFALYANGRGFGFACMEGGQKLIDCGVVTVLPVCNRKIMKKLKKLFAYVKPTLVFVQDGNGKYSRTGTRTKRLIKRIISFAKEQNLPTQQYSRDQIRVVFEQFGAKTKYEIAQKIIGGLPELKFYAPKIRDLNTSEDRYMGIFDAVSLVLTHYYLEE